MEFLEQYHINLIFRMLFAGICGIIIGFERTNRAKEAGIRTHCIVACASALMMIISKYGFFDMIKESAIYNVDIRLDPSRMAQGIITGVGFLGAGMIYFQRGSVKGLTTAAGVWATSGIGMAIGAGMYMVGLSATFLILLTQILLHINNKYILTHKTKTLKIYGVNEPEFQDKASLMLARMGIIVLDVSASKTEDNIYDYAFSFEIPKQISEEELLNEFNYKCSIDFTH